jgi:hypothetical protein
MDLQTVATLGGVLIVGKVGYTLIEKILWDWLKGSRNGKIISLSKAADMPVTHSELEHHCDKAQGQCVKILEPRFQLMASEAAKATVKEFGSQILPRLMRGDLVFDDLEERVKDLEIMGIRHEPERETK